MQERLEKITIAARWGVIGVIGAGTLAAALFSGCSGDFSKKNEPVKSSDEKKQSYSDPRLVSEKRVEYLENGPELFDPRINMGLPSSESELERITEKDVQQTNITRTNRRNPSNYQTPVQLPITPNYQTAQEPVAQPSQSPNYQAQPLQPVQTPRANDYQNTQAVNPSPNYQSTDQSYQPRTVPRTDNNLDSNQPRGF